MKVQRNLPTAHPGSHLRIAMFTDSYLPINDGVVTTIVNYRRGLEASGHSMYIFAPDTGQTAPEKNVFRYPSLVFPPYPQYRAALFPVIPASVAKKTGVQLVHSKAMMTMAISAAAFAKKSRLPCMASLETMIPDGVHYVLPFKSLEPWGKRVTWNYMKWLYRKFDLVTSPSRHIQSMLSDQGVESVVLPSPIDTVRFSPNKNGEKAKRQFGIAGKKVILSVGRVVKEKNYELLLSTAKKLRDPDAVFLIAGRGPYLETLRKRIVSEGLQRSFVFAGYLPGDKLVDCYNCADTFVFPSNFETQGLTHLEAMGCGIPACVLEGTPMAEIVKEGRNGYIFSNDPADCAQKLVECMARSKQMSGEARKTALTRSIPRCTGELVKVYRRLLETKR